MAPAFSCRSVMGYEDLAAAVREREDVRRPSPRLGQRQVCDPLPGGRLIELRRVHFSRAGIISQRGQPATRGSAPAYRSIWRAGLVGRCRQRHDDGALAPPALELDAAFDAPRDEAAAQAPHRVGLRAPGLAFVHCLPLGLRLHRRPRDLPAHQRMRKRLPTDPMMVGPATTCSGSVTSMIVVRE